MKACIKHNQLDTGQGWKKEKQYIVDVITEKALPVKIEDCPECTKPFEARNYLLGIN